MTGIFGCFNLPAWVVIYGSAALITWILADAIESIIRIKKHYKDRKNGNNK